MKKLLLVGLAIVFSASTAMAAKETLCYGWEDPTATTLGNGYNLSQMTISNSTAQFYDGSRSLEVWKSQAIAGTPQAYVAWITNLAPGDSVTAFVETYDTTVGTNPSVRIWGHWSDSIDVNSYVSSASGNNTYSGSVTAGWEGISYTWVATAAATGLVVEIRGYNSSTAPVMTPCYVDHLCITHAINSSVMFPGTTVVGVENSPWSSVKALYR